MVGVSFWVLGLVVWAALITLGAWGVICGGKMNLRVFGWFCCRVVGVVWRVFFGVKLVAFLFVICWRVDII